MTEVILTPSQTAGPYLSIGLLRVPTACELIDPSDARAIRIRGRVLDAVGDGVPDGVVEVWQGNAAGRHRPPADDPENVPPGPGFLRFGPSGAEDDGRFGVVTGK